MFSLCQIRVPYIMQAVQDMDSTGHSVDLVSLLLKSSLCRVRTVKFCSKVSCTKNKVPRS